VLARHAESLYWIGRYVERADGTARILDAAVHRLLEDVTVDVDRAARDLLGVLGVVPQPGAVLDIAALTELVARSDAASGSIASSIARAREHACRAREAVPAELGRCLDGRWLAPPEQPGPAFLPDVECRAATFAGMAASTMSRDDSWRFLLLGHSVERADMVVRLLLSRIADRVSAPGWLTVLRCAGARDTYLRTYPGPVDAARVAQFLVLDRLFPRSVFHALRQAESCLEQLDRRPAVRVGTTAEAARLLGRARSELEFLRPDELLDDLPGRLLALQERLRDVGGAIAVEYFHAATWVACSPSEVRA
jgi:uncharacterized alpha-E superfamily protein